MRIFFTRFIQLVLTLRRQTTSFGPSSWVPLQEDWRRKIILLDLEMQGIVRMMSIFSSEQWIRNWKWSLHGHKSVFYSRDCYANFWQPNRNINLILLFTEKWDKCSITSTVFGTSFLCFHEKFGSCFIWVNCWTSSIFKSFYLGAVPYEQTVGQIQFSRGLLFVSNQRYI